MSGPVTRSRAKNMQEPEPEPGTSAENKEPTTSTPVKDNSLRVRSKTSTVSHNISEREQTIRSNVSSVVVRKKEAELAAAKRLAKLNLEQTLIQKELEVTLARLDAEEAVARNQAALVVAAFKNAVADTRASSTENEVISKLRRCLKGEARVTVAALLDTHVSVAEIMEALELRFGLPELILQEEIQALKDLPKLVDNTDQLSKFACKVRNCVSTIKALKKPEHLHNMELLRTLKQKIPHLKTRWLSYALEHEHQTEPELVKLSEFLKKEAQTTSKYWMHETTRTAIKPMQQHKTHYAISEDSDSDPEPELCYASSQPKAPLEMLCLYCNSKTHLLKNCEQFLRLSIDERWEWAKEAKVCFKCLKSRHHRESCRARPCGTEGCRMSHNRLLHSPTPRQPDLSAFVHPSTSSPQSNPEVETEKPPQETTACGRANKSRVLLKFIPVRIQGPIKSKLTYAFLDGGSTLTLLKQDLANEIGLKGIAEPMSLTGMNATADHHGSQRLDVEVTGPSNVPLKLYDVRTVEKLPISPQTVANIDEYEHLKDLPKTGLCYEYGVPELLIGLDNWQATITKEVRKGKRTEPLATLTPLGWVVHGFSHSHTNTVHFVGHTDEDLHRLIEDYFTIDALGVTNKMKLNEDDERAIAILKKTARRVEDGKRWEVGLLWKEDNPVMPKSFSHASKRLLSVEKKMDKDLVYGQKYKDNMDNFLNSGYAGPCEPVQSPKKWYLPHFGVTNINKPGKLRIVHDAASKVQGISLNDKLLTGPDLLLSLLAVIFKFREGEVAVSADIKEMFLQIRIRPEDRPAQRFLWREFDRKGPMKEFEMKSVIFGATSSPATAIYIKNRNAEDFTEDYPEAVEAIKTRFYMDDYLHSFHSVEIARKITKEVAHINKEGGFTLTQWVSNNESVMQEIEESKRGSGGVNLDFNVNVKILGLRWNPCEDTFGFNLNLTKLPTEIIDHTRKPTKREALKVVMSVFDPLGLLTPIVIQGKILLQQIWRSGIGWDQDVQDDDHLIWKRWIGRLINVCTCKVPRHYVPEPTSCAIELHIFCDASEKAYASVAYWRFVREDGKIWVALVTSKSRVTPLKPVSIPRLELQAAVLATRLACAIEKDHDTIKPAKRYFWTDSSAVISWIKGDPRNYKTFVSNRLGEIAENTNNREWRWLSTSHNVADDATREIENLDPEHRWFKGPSFLYQQPERWPSYSEVAAPTSLLEIKKPTYDVLPVSAYTTTCLPDITRLPKWLRLIRATAHVFTFLESIRTKERTGLKLEHIKRAEEAWAKQSQSQSFPIELEDFRNNRPCDKNSRLHDLCSFIDNHGLLRLRGEPALLTK
ncbi:uncharacterized protein LOC125231325 [Leguminivora glycinivorella]|uniref:uncharacterized protein LOC125231325 n=1 Tax=Leguminivora glycinivorella TaxID=1035111 RepID=UPI00200E9F0D|nr:uncharacterized protein LOC125231325 [Leguminivora glycinivorella]